MGVSVRRLVIGVGTAAAVASLLLSQAAMASAAPGGAARSAVAFDCTAPYVPPADTVTTTNPVTLTLNSTGPDVLLLQNRLNCLHYWVGPINGTFGWDTMFAVWAFKEVQARKIVPPNPNVVDAATQALLVSPKAPPVTTPGGAATRIEVNKAIQVMVLYKNKQVFLITHVSTAKYCRVTDGCKWITPDGKFYAHSFWATPLAKPVIGRLGPLWNPVWYVGTSYAIHGDSTPTTLAAPTTTAAKKAQEKVVWLTPESHGCVRIPYDLSKVFHTYIKLGAGTTGTPIYITGPMHQ